MPHVTMGEREISMLRVEIELLMKERQCLLKTVGATASFVSSLNYSNLPGHIRKTADQLSSCLNALPEETLHDALQSQGEITRL
ncbi:MAG: hypothetical protein RQ714_06445 [Nitrosomonas sp.]|nr:hypothetical protein [Nitrosomonas sp.]